MLENGFHMKLRFIAIALMALPGLCFAGSLRSQIQASEKPIARAMMHRDIGMFKRAVKGGMTDDFQYIDDGGAPMGFDKMVEGIRQTYAMMTKVTRATSKVILVQQSGDKGSAVEKHFMEGMIRGEDKKLHKMLFVGTSTETYRKEHGRWKMASMSMKTDKMLMDGHPVSMAGAGGGH
jgi:uncharacterized protein DUF4440